MAHALIDNEILPVRAVLVDDAAPFRAGLRRALPALGIAIVGEADNGRDALRLATELRPDVVVMDPELGGIDATQRIAALPDAPAVVVLADIGSTTILGALLAGACSFLFKDAKVPQIADAIRLAAKGQSSLAPRAGRALVDRLLALESGCDLAAWASCPPELTPHEQKILTLLAKGYTDAAIGKELYLSASTVRHHITGILGKLDATSRAQAAAEAARFGLV
ncbi:MAG: response regulator transcription factor [Actinobacteria bacterium]|nr:response regulator transcription factor [Actinomycetota bacterium]